jgi:hypothetical protein
MNDHEDFERRFGRTVADWLDATAPKLDPVRVTRIAAERARRRPRRWSMGLVPGVAVTLLLASAAVIAFIQPGGAPPAAVPEPSASQSGTPRDPMAAAHFTADFASTAGSDPAWTQAEGYQEVVDLWGAGTVAATDPRISGAWQQVRDMRKYPTDDIVVSTGSARIDNHDGSWSGTFTGAYEAHGKGFAEEWNVLTGSGAYEGLTALFHWTGAWWGNAGSSLEGVIVPSSDVPPQPGPIAKPAG